ncbi:hypothetical protein V1520DRAFT_349408 [Lipomyces starkeyi]
MSDDCHSSDAMSATYKVLIESDGLLSSFSYQNSHFQSVVIATRPPGQKSYVLTVLFMVGQAMVISPNCGLYKLQDRAGHDIAYKTISAEENSWRYFRNIA